MPWFSLSNDTFSFPIDYKHSCHLYLARFCGVFKKGCNVSSDYSFNQGFEGSFEHQLSASPVSQRGQGVMAETLWQQRIEFGCWWNVFPYACSFLSIQFTALCFHMMWANCSNNFFPGRVVVCVQYTGWGTHMETHTCANLCWVPQSQGAAAVWFMCRVSPWLCTNTVLMVPSQPEQSKQFWFSGEHVQVLWKWLVLTQIRELLHVGTVEVSLVCIQRQANMLPESTFCWQLSSCLSSHLHILLM